MKSKSKKLIALLAIACAATTVAGFAACGDKDKDKDAVTVTNGKSAYEIAVEHGFEGTEEEWLAALKGEKGDQGAAEHAHQFGAEITTVIAPTGVEDGVGYKVCAADGKKEWVVIPKLAGVIAKNPMKLTIDSEVNVSVNGYDSASYGNKEAKGEKGIMYYAVESTQAGLISLSSELPEGVSVSYMFCSDETFAEEGWAGRQLYMASEDEPGMMYVKATYTDAEGNPWGGDITLMAKVANADEEQTYTFKLSQGTASAIRVSAVNSWDESIMNDDFTFVDGVATVQLSPANIYSYTYNYELIGLDGDYFAFETDLSIPSTDDGTYDFGYDFTVAVGKQYEYSFKVTDKDNAPKEGAKVIITDGNGESIMKPTAWGGLTADPDYKLTTDANGVATKVLKETWVDGEAIFDYAVKVEGDLGFGNYAPQDIIPLIPEEDEGNVVIQADYSVATWTVGTAAPSFKKGNQEYATVTVAAAGKYILTLSEVNNKTTLGMKVFNVKVNGGDAVSNSQNSVATVELEVELTEGENEIAISVLGDLTGLSINSTLTVKPVVSENALTMGVAKEVVPQDEVYTFVAPAAGTYSFIFSGNHASEGVVYTKAAWEAWPPEAPLKGNQITLTEGEEIELVFDNNGNPGGFYVTVGDEEALAHMLYENQAKTVESGETYTFNSMYATETVFTVTINVVGTATDVQAIMVGTDYDNYNNLFVFDSFGGGTPAASYTFDVTVGPNGTQNFYVEHSINGNATSITFTVAPKVNAGGK